MFASLMERTAMSVLDAAYGFARHAWVSSSPAWVSGGFEEDAGRYRDHEDIYRRKYRHWRGRSGRSYVFTVYTPGECPAYENTVLVVAERGGAEVLACIDLGPFPEARLFKLRRRLGDRLDEIEFQIHVLAERQGDRQSLIDDIAPPAA
jgi:hypothetical protein